MPESYIVTHIAVSVDEQDPHRCPGRNSKRRVSDALNTITEIIVCITGGYDERYLFLSECNDVTIDRSLSLRTLTFGEFSGGDRLCLAAYKTKRFVGRDGESRPGYEYEDKNKLRMIPLI